VIRRQSKTNKQPNPIRQSKKTKTSMEGAGGAQKHLRDTQLTQLQLPSSPPAALKKKRKKSSKRGEDETDR
jgi:hypothetical protein